MDARVSRGTVRRALQVATATLLVAGCPVAVVWWLRDSGTVASAPLALLIGMALSLLANWVGRTLWETRPGSEDLLFNELMVWGYVHRRLRQRRLESTESLVRAADSDEARRQRRLLERLVSGMETRDPYLHGHSRRVARHSWMIAQRMKLPREEVARVRIAAALHDVGKTRTPKTILHKPGRLTDEEFRIIQLHPGEGAEMAAVLGDPKLTAMIRHHHERTDGSGYPDGLTGETLPLGARIIAVADTFDAITSARPYRAPSPHKRAIDILQQEAGIRLDADVVKAFRGHYAGRGPLALWSLVADLPERVLTWLSSSAATVASAAKVVAVAAIVGGAAATSSTIGLVEASAGGARHPSGSEAAVSAPAASSSSHVSAAHLRAERLGRAGGPQPGRRGSHSRRSHPHAHAAPVAKLPSTSGPASAGSSGAAPLPAAREENRSSSGNGAHNEPTRGKTEEAPVAKGEEKTVTTKEEHAPSKQPPTPAGNEEHGHSGEAPGHVKQEEGASTPAEPPREGGHEPGSKGNGSSGESGHGSSGEAPGHGSSAEAPGHGKP